MPEAQSPSGEALPPLGGRRRQGCRQSVWPEQGFDQADGDDTERACVGSLVAGRGGRLGQGLSPNDWDNLLALAVLLRQPPPGSTTSAGSSKSSALIESRYSAPVRPWVQMSTRLWGVQR